MKFQGVSEKKNGLRGMPPRGSAPAIDTSRPSGVLSGAALGESKYYMADEGKRAFPSGPGARDAAAVRVAARVAAARDPA